MENNNIIAIRKEDTIYANIAFSTLMKKTEETMNANAHGRIEFYKGMSPKQMEQESLKVIRQCCVESPFNPDNIYLVSGQSFPDIIAEKYYGVEVKSTNKDLWISTGSSIVESTRDKYVENIYMLFGKLGGEFAEFRCRPYEEVLYDIAVTHSPRYLIDMNLSSGDTIFDKMGQSYFDLRTSENPISTVKHYYRAKADKNGKQMPWWLSGDSDNPTSVNMNLRLWSDLSSDEKKDITAQMFILFPEVIAGQYGKAALWLASAKGIVCNNIRDPFSAGGKIKKISGNTLSKPIPRVIKTISDKYSNIIQNLDINGPIGEHIREYNQRLLSSEDTKGIWLNEVDTIIKRLRLNIDIKDILINNRKLE